MHFVSLCLRYWPAGGLGLTGEEVHSVVGEAGGAARLLCDQGELAAQTGDTAAIPRLWNQTYSRFRFLTQ